MAGRAMHRWTGWALRLVGLLLLGVAALAAASGVWTYVQYRTGWGVTELQQCCMDMPKRAAAFVVLSTPWAGLGIAVLYLGERRMAALGTWKAPAPAWSAAMTILAGAALAGGVGVCVLAVVLGALLGARSPWFGASVTAGFLAIGGTMALAGFRLVQLYSERIRRASE